MVKSIVMSSRRKAQWRQGTALSLCLVGVSAVAAPQGAMAQAQPVVNVCSPASVTLPALTPIGNVTSGLLGGTLDPLLNGLVGNINTNVGSVLNGQPISVSVLDTSGNLVSLPSNDCAVGIANGQGIAVGGGQISGLGGTGNPVANAGAASSIAIGNGSSTLLAMPNAVALGTNATALTTGSVALGANSVASRFNSPVEMFTGSILGLDPTAGVVSVGSALSPRQITNVAGGTADTDAVNVRQLRTVGSSLANALGGGAGFVPLTGTFTAPTYVIRGTTYNDVGSALTALNAAIGTGTGTGTGNLYPIVGNNATDARPVATGANSVAAGYQAASMGQAASALGDSSQAMGQFSTAVGGRSAAMGVASVALGVATQAMDIGTTAVGGASMAQYAGSTAIGAGARAIADPTTAVGSNSLANGNNAIAIGANSTSSGDSSSAIGTDAVALGDNSVALGRYAKSTANNSLALGSYATSTAVGGIAIGTNAVADRMNAANEAFTGAGLRTTLGTVSFGSAGNERQITNVAGGTADTDAVNVRQLRTVGTNLANSLGGGAAFDQTTGTYTAPTYTVAGATYNNVGSAIGALDSSGVKYDMDPSTGTRTNSLTLVGGDPNAPVVIHNVAAGVAPTDAVNVGQLKEVAAQTLQQANAYTDSRINGLNGQIASVKKEARQGGAIGLAAASLRYDDRPGKISMAAGGSTWQGVAGFAAGIGYTTLDGAARMNVAATSADGKWGVGGGLSITLN